MPLLPPGLDLPSRRAPLPYQKRSRVFRVLIQSVDVDTFTPRPSLESDAKELPVLIRMSRARGLPFSVEAGL